MEHRAVCDVVCGAVQVLNIRIPCQDGEQNWWNCYNNMKVCVDVVWKHWGFDSGMGNGFTLQSDGASNFTCTAFSQALSRLHQCSKMHLKRHIISEVGDGKNLVDTDFQQVSDYGFAGLKLGSSSHPHAANETEASVISQ